MGKRGRGNSDSTTGESEWDTYSDADVRFIPPDMQLQHHVGIIKGP
jgi:hypothetical protein